MSNQINGQFFENIDKIRLTNLDEMFFFVLPKYARTMRNIE